MDQGAGSGREGGGEVSVASQTCYWIVCDKCGESYEEDDQILHFDTDGEAQRHTLDAYWHIGRRRAYERISDEAT